MKEKSRLCVCPSLSLLILSVQIHRLVVIDDYRCPIGIISLSDLLSKIVLTPERLAT